MDQLSALVPHIMKQKVFKFASAKLYVITCQRPLQPLRLNLRMPWYAFRPLIAFLLFSLFDLVLSHSKSELLF